MANINGTLQTELTPLELLRQGERVDVSSIIQPAIEIFGFTISEPTTFITDLFVAMVCFYAYWRLNKEGKKNDNNVFLYTKIFFLFLGSAAVWGGAMGHGFIHIFSQVWKLPGWFMSMIAVGFLERASISHANRLISPKLGRFFLVLNAVELITLFIITGYTMHFKFVELHSAYGFLIVIFSFHLYTYIKTKDRGSWWMLINTLVLLVVVFIFNYPIIIHEFFNHRDLAHMFMCLSCYLIMVAALNLGKTSDKQKVQTA